ncbi:MAG TPA: hypothetical protein PLV91_00745 [Verrucomicrobiota bacterium]|nr:hypothetical protein [Verrucomicrobiota bacterium]
MGNFYGPSNLRNEMGDEIYFAGDARTIERIEIECYSSIKTLSPEKYAIVRLYREDGPEYENSDEYYKLYLPKTLLYESHPIQLVSGHSLICLDGLNIQVEDPCIAWTIQFYGLSIAEKDTMGVIMYDSPTVGSSYGDFWMRAVDENYQSAEEFKPFYFGEVLKANFGVRVYASPASIVTCSKVESVQGGVSLTIRGPAYSPVGIQASFGPADEWFTVASRVLESDTTTVFLKGPPAAYYRAVGADKVPPALQMGVLDGQTSFLKAHGAAGRRFAFGYSTNAIDWVRSTNVFIASWNIIQDAHATATRSQCFYSISEVEEEEPGVHQILLMPDQESNWVHFRGPRGKQALVSYSFDETNWSKPILGQFTYFPALKQTKSGLLVFPFPRVPTDIGSTFETFFKIELLDR